MGPTKEHLYFLYQFELTDFMSPLNSLGILFQFVFLRTDLDLGDCFFSVSTLFSVQWKVASEILPCGLTLTKTSITHHQVTPIPDLGSEHIRGVSQVIPRRVLQTPSAMQETQETRVQSLGQQDPLEEEMATHSSIPAGKIPWTEKPVRLWSMGSRWVRPTEATEHACIHAHVVKLQKAKQIRKNPNFHSSTRRTHSKTLSQPWHLTEAQFSLL